MALYKFDRILLCASACALMLIILRPDSREIILEDSSVPSQLRSGNSPKTFIRIIGTSSIKSRSIGREIPELSHLLPPFCRTDAQPSQI